MTLRELLTIVFQAGRDSTQSRPIDHSLGHDSIKENMLNARKDYFDSWLFARDFKTFTGWKLDD